MRCKDVLKAWPDSRCGRVGGDVHHKPPAGSPVNYFFILKIRILRFLDCSG